MRPQAPAAREGAGGEGFGQKGGGEEEEEEEIYMLLETRERVQTNEAGAPHCANKLKTHTF